MSAGYFHKRLPELLELQELIVSLKPHVRTWTLTECRYKDMVFPVQALRLFKSDYDRPAVVFTGGVHGLERIGTQVLLAYLHSVMERLTWDDGLRKLLKDVTVYFIPLINPVGMFRRRRSNGNGVDLMRNAPQDALGKTPFLAGGHRYSSRLPFYRGEEGEGLQPEMLAVERFFQKRILKHSSVYSIDCHSGFGNKLQMWFPWACNPAPFEQIAQVYALYNVFRLSYPYHPYVWEPQSKHYLANGDFWDYMYLRNNNPGQVFLPLTLEMGSWLWVKKNWQQMFYPHGIFNPVLPHRLRRVLRQNITLFDFFIQAAASEKNWMPGKRHLKTHRRDALMHWGLQ
jgi:hypothetical protein